MSSDRASDYAIEVEDLSKVYGLPFELSWRGVRSVIPKGDVALSRRHLALKQMTFSVRPGELLGVIGRNGAGKSTLLKVLAGVSPPTRGRVSVRGRIFPMIELNAGMSQTMTGRENVQLLGTILGLSPKFIAARMDEIEEFCDLGEWFDKPVWQYSSGMPGRLGFAIAAYSEADVLLIDEILAVGDLAFRNKCTEKMNELRESGSTVVLVSHNMGAISGLCTRTIMIEQGEIVYDSLPDVTVQHYKDFVATLAQKKIQKRMIQGLEVTAAPDFAVHGMLLLNHHGRPRDELRAEYPMTVLMDLEKPLQFEEALLEFVISTAEGQLCVEERRPIMIEGPPAYRRVSVELPEGLPLRDGNYVVTLRLSDDRTRANVITAQRPFTLTRKRATAGLVAPELKIAVASPTIVQRGVPPLRVHVA